MRCFRLCLFWYLTSSLQEALLSLCGAQRSQPGGWVAGGSGWQTDETWWYGMVWYGPWRCFCFWSLFLFLFLFLASHRIALRRSSSSSSSRVERQKDMAKHSLFHCCYLHLPVPVPVLLPLPLPLPATCIPPLRQYTFSLHKLVAAWH